MSSFNKGGMYILSSPSGAGKTTLVRKISRNKNYSVSISHTTRSPRPNEIHGKDYYFVSKNTFKKLIKKGEFLEHAKVFDNYYGSSTNLIANQLKQGKNIIFVLPPSKEELLKRLIKREKKNLKTVMKRMRGFKKDLLRWEEYDYVVINDDLKSCYNKIMKVIDNKKNFSFDRKFIKKHVMNLLS